MARHVENYGPNLLQNKGKHSLVGHISHAIAVCLMHIIKYLHSILPCEPSTCQTVAAVAAQMVSSRNISSPCQRLDG